MSNAIGIALTVNGEAVRESVEPRKTLVDFLREDLGLTNEEFVDFALLCGTDFTDRVNK